MTLEQKLDRLNELVIDKMIESIENGEIKALELQGAISLLKNNKVVLEQSDTKVQEHLKLKGMINK